MIFTSGARWSLLTLLFGEPGEELPAPTLIHASHELEGLAFFLPLCWAHEGIQRGATAEEWEVSYDHGALPAAWVVSLPDGKDTLTCRECIELVHA